jgi:hypothetical protein
MYIAMTKTSLFAAALAMASTASAHMYLLEPVPFGYDHPDRAPLSASGSNFPCQVGAGGSYIVKQMNKWTVGSKVTLGIEPNSATHSGGSCQVSVTKDKEPTPQSVWKVIHSIEGGCPQNQEGNVVPKGNFTFTIPPEVPDGRLTMAWTWFNKSGNREMYMNCAPIEVSGSSGDGLDSLPDMAVANIDGQNTCKTTPLVDYTFANPGKYVTTAGLGPYTDLCGGAPSAGVSTGGGAPSEGGSTGGYGSNNGSGSPGGVNSGNSGAAVPPATPIETPKQPNATTPKEPEATTPKEPESSAPKPPSTGNSSSGGSSSGGSSSGGASSGGASGGVASSGGSSCSEEGAITCKDQDHFGICSNGSLVWQSVAAGTACNNGVIARRGYMHRHQRHSI